MIEVGLAACASMAWGASDFAAGLAARRRSVLVVLAASQCTGLVLAGLVLAISGIAAPTPGALAMAALAGAFEAIGFGALYAALARGPMGVVAPVAALGGVIPLVAGIAGGHGLSLLAVGGCVAALAAVVLVSREPGVDGASRAPGLALALASAAAFGLFFLFLDLAASEADFVWSVAAARAVAVALVLPVLLLRGARPGRSAARTSPREVGALAIVGALDIAANLLFAWGASRADGPLVAVVGSTYPVTTVLLAAGLLGERLGAAQRLGVALALAATALLAL